MSGTEPPNPHVLLFAFADYRQSPCLSPHCFIKYLCETAMRIIDYDSGYSFRYTRHQSLQRLAMQSSRTQTSGLEILTKAPSSER